MSDVVEPPSWPILDSEPGPDLRIFRVRLDRVENPRSGHRFRAIVLETPDWVNVVARTDSGDVVMVRQFRFGVRAVTLEIPGGMIEPGEDPEAAAARELLEETGYVAARWTSLGWVEPNPAFHENRCFSFLAEGAREVSAPTPDLGEDLRVTRLSEAEVRRQVNDGKIRHSLVLCALARVFDLRPPL